MLNFVRDERVRLTRLNASTQRDRTPAKAAASSSSKWQREAHARVVTVGVLGLVKEQVLARATCGDHRLAFTVKVDVKQAGREA